MWVPCDISMTSAPDVWVQSVRVTDMWGQVNGQYGRVSNGLRIGPVWAGPGRTRGVLGRSHVTAMGLHWAMVHGSRSMVDRVFFR